MKNKTMLALLLCAVLSIGLLTTGCSGKTEAPSAQEPEADAPPVQDSEEKAGTASALGSLHSFSADTLDGGVFTQDDIAAKDVTVMNFWALSCGPCIVEMPDLAAFAGALPDNAQVVTVCLDGNGNEDTAREVLQEAGFEGVTLITGSEDLLELSQNLMYTPTTIFVDSDGNLVGDAIIGGQENLSATFLDAVNVVLQAGGKAEISLEG
ncbi:MAG: TlpA family protein disulfide reductase [Oscillibacter sp.]|nr:TlpA family protein disulfide reductase [Oscillibacter sp.]